MIENEIEQAVRTQFMRHLKDKPFMSWEHTPKTRFIVDWIDEDEAKIVKYAMKRVLRYGQGVKMERYKDGYAFEITDVDDELIWEGLPK